MERSQPIRLTRETRKIQRYLRAIEANHYLQVLEAGESLDQGRVATLGRQANYESEVFTGSGLCRYSSELLKEKLDKKYPKIKTDVVTGRVTPWDNSSQRFDHFWLRLYLSDGTRMFADATYGQVRPWINRLVFDFAEHEPEYYGKDIWVERCLSISPEQALKDRFYRKALASCRGSGFE